MLSDMTVFGICGYSGAGKTTLIERIIPRLSAGGLKVAVVKHDAHGFIEDWHGKDSDRYYRTGADVLVLSPREEVICRHATGEREFFHSLAAISGDCDIVLIEGCKTLPVTKVWLLSEGETQPPPHVNAVVSVLPRNSDRIGEVMLILDDWLPRQWLKPPVYGCILVGGKSTRMGRPKHLIDENGKTWLERTAGVLRETAEKIVVAGADTVPQGMRDCVFLPDSLDVNGPMSGILSAMRWAPNACWIAAACDMPCISPEALRWLVSNRRPGVWAVLPKLQENNGIEPLLSFYDFRSRGLLEKLATRGEFSPACLAGNEKVITPITPAHITAAWKNVNTEAELRAHLE